VNTNDQKKLIKDRGGTRSGIDRRKRSFHLYVPERKSGEDRRNGSDRRLSFGVKRKLNYKAMHNTRIGIDRRDAFRKEV
jgi:hypothetical protein